MQRFTLEKDILLHIDEETLRRTMPQEEAQSRLVDGRRIRDLIDTGTNKHYLKDGVRLHVQEFTLSNGLPFPVGYTIHWVILVSKETLPDGLASLLGYPF